MIKSLRKQFKQAPIILVYYQSDDEIKKSKIKVTHWSFCESGIIQKLRIS